MTTFKLKNKSQRLHELWEKVESRKIAYWEWIEVFSKKKEKTQ